MKKAILFSSLFISTCALSQSFSTNPNKSLNKPVNTGYLKGSSAITESTDPATITTGSVSCINGGLVADNNFYRRFDLDGTHSITDWFDVTSVDIGVDQSSSGTGGTQPITVNLYSIPNADPLLLANLTLVGSTSTTIVNLTSAIQNLPVTGSVGGTNKDLVVEIAIPDGVADGHQFFIGSNALGQTSLGYITSTACSITEITSLDNIGFPDMHIVMTVNGNLNMVPVELQNFSIE